MHAPAAVTPITLSINTNASAKPTSASPKSLQIQHPAQDPRPPATVIELRIRLDAVLSDAAKAFRAINPIVPSDLDVASLRSLAAYGIDKFRALSREFAASP